MPELPEVERATRMLKANAVGKTIQQVQTVEDVIVFSGISNENFANEITGRKIKDVARYGKVFYLELDGDGRMPVLHFGMTGYIHIKGQLPVQYKEGPRNARTDWPPRFMKFILFLVEDSTSPATEIAFVDARRLGRVRLCRSPLTEPPISSLGFDPILSMPSLETFSNLILKRMCAVKALFLDQSFCAGVGNWVADEILYHARVHPEQKSHTLTKDQLLDLHLQTAAICRVAVDVNADSSKFPDNWLFKHRWGKGKKKDGQKGLKLPSGHPATIKWVTVGGRTSAYVVELQRLNVSQSQEVTEAKLSDEESDLTSLSESQEEELRVPEQSTSRMTRGNKRRKLTSG